MSRDEGDLGSPRDEDMDIGIQTSDKLDLNLDQDCQSPNVAQVSGNQYSLCSKDDSVTGGILKIGTEFESDEHAYTFYNKYARLVGFSVRKDWVNRSKVHGLVVSRKFTCSKEGYRRKDKRDANVKKHRKETRTGCLAHMIITRQPDGKYQVTHFEAKHNHDVKPNNAQTFQLQEELCVSQASKDDFSSNLGMGSNSTLELMNKRIEVGESLDYLAMNFKNYLQSERTRDMKKGDAGRLLHYFQRQHFENPAFFHAIQVDIDDKISNIFWADDKMVADYEHFGDVVCLDTTYRISKDIQPFVQFVGLNHHNLAITFAAALLFDDTVESLKWLFTTFIEAMSGKKPKVILIDQDAGIVEAINSVLPETSHHICVWQMYQNALKHLNHALKDIESFSSDFRSCIYDHNDEEDFIHAWEALLEKYDLQQNEWLRWMFREKEKWAVVYGRNTFFVDAKGSHVVEDLYNNFRGHLNSDQDALQFFKVFERMVDEQRFKEIQANDEMIRCMPRLIGNVVLLKHASDIYTPKAFEIFQREYEKSLNFVVSQYSESEIFLEYKVNTFGRSREYTVTFNPSDDTVICSCMKFENVGILCGHALKVLDNRNIKVVPSQYILKRWTKDARTGRVGETKEFIAQENSKLVAASRYKELCHRILAISARAIESEDAFQFASRQLDDVIEGVEKIMAFKTEGVQGMSSSSTAANVSESENPEIFLDERTMEDQDKDNRVARISEKENAAPDRQQQKNIIEKCSRKKGLTSAPPPPYTINFVFSPPQPCVSTEAQTHNSVLQGLYQEVQSMYQQQNSVMNHQDNPNPYQQSNFYSDQHDSPRQTPLLQAMDLDLQHPQPSSFL